MSLKQEFFFLERIPQTLLASGLGLLQKLKKLVVSVTTYILLVLLQTLYRGAKMVSSTMNFSYLFGVYIFLLWLQHRNGKNEMGMPKFFFCRGCSIQNSLVVCKKEAAVEMLGQVFPLLCWELLHKEPVFLVFNLHLLQGSCN